MASSPKDPKQQKTKPIRRNDVIHCENCGEDYSVTYKRCPFCDERPAKNGRPRTAGGRRVAGGGRSGRPANPLQVAALVGSLVLIIVAMYIVFTSLAPLFSKGEDDPGGSQADPGASTSQTGPDASSTPSGSQGDISQPEPEPPVTVDVTSLTLDKSDFTLQAGESATIQAAVVPADAEITWSSSDESAATVSPEGVVSNVNTGSSQVKVTITATAGDKTAECVVFCRAGGGAGSSSSGTTGTVTGAAAACSSAPDRAAAMRPSPPFWRETPLPFWRTWATAGTGSALSEAAAEPQRAMCPKIISRSPELLCSGPSPRGRPGIFAVFGLTK